jgi:hypothetical protein
MDVSSNSCPKKRKMGTGQEAEIECPKVEMKEISPINEPHARTNWRHAVAAYTDRRVLQVLALGFSSGLPFLLTYSTLSAWLATNGVRRGSDWHFRPGWHALRIQVSLGAADGSRASATAFGTTARLGNHHPDPSDRRNSRAGIVQSKAQLACGWLLLRCSSHFFLRARIS